MKIGNFWNFFFLQNWKTQLSKNIWIYVIAFAPIVIQTQQAPQNDRRNLSFVKGTIVVGNRMTRKGPKMTISKGCLFNFRTDFIVSNFIYLGVAIYSKTSILANFKSLFHSQFAKNWNWNKYKWKLSFACPSLKIPKHCSHYTFLPQVVRIAR